MELEEWILELLDAIRAASELDATFDIHLEKKTVKELAKQYESITTIELC